MNLCAKGTLNSLTNTNISSKQSKANNCIHIKIIHSETELTSFFEGSLDSIENVFNPKFSNQIFEDEIIFGYIEPKILVALTPLTWNACFKITYKYKYSEADDIEKKLKEFLGDKYYSNSIDDFLINLNKDNNLLSLDGYFSNFNVLENKDVSKFNNNNIKFQYGIWKVLDEDKNNKFHINLERLITFFINGASEIPLEFNHWFYYLLFQFEYQEIDINGEKEMTVKNIKLVGFSTVARFHWESDCYRSMISQFFIYPEYQRSGHGQNLLSLVIVNESIKNECKDVSTEDPSEDYIYLRDVVLLKLFCPYFVEKYHSIKKKISDKSSSKEINRLSKISSIDDFDILTLTEDELSRLSLKNKISQELIKRIEILFKYTVTFGKTIFEQVLFDDANSYLVYVNKENFYTKLNKKISFIYFEDDEEFDEQKILNDEKNEMNLDNLANDLDKYSAQLIDDFAKIHSKCNKLLNICEEKFVN